jgi:hypothetical protein
MPWPGSSCRAAQRELVDASVTGSAEALLLLLWKRTTLGDARLTVTGSHTAAATVLAQPLTP